MNTEKEKALQKLIELARCGLHHNYSDYTFHKDKHEEFDKMVELLENHASSVDVEELRKEFKEWYKNTNDIYCHNVVDFFLPHLQAPHKQTQGEWISVEFAPIDGTKLLGYCEDSECYYIIYYNRSMGNGCWNCCDSTYLPKIKRFQYLPQPPKQTT